MYGKKSFNINVEEERERNEIMEKLYNNQLTNINNSTNISVINLYQRYIDIGEFFPDNDINVEILPYFIDWLIYNVDMVEIKAYDVDDAYNIFETMNDRGLRLNPADMLKGYLISNIQDIKEKYEINAIWKEQNAKLINNNINIDNFFKVWLRAKYITKNSLDFDNIGSAFHKWVRENKHKMNLNTKKDFYNFIKKDFVFYSNLYIELLNYSLDYNPNFPYIYNNNFFDFTLQYPLILSAIKPNDNRDIIDKKINLVTKFIETIIVLRRLNYEPLTYNSISYWIANLIIEIKDLEYSTMKNILIERLIERTENIDDMARLGLSDYQSQQTRKFVHFLLARMTYHIEKKSSINSNMRIYLNRDPNIPFTIEHIIPDKYHRYISDFVDEAEFINKRKMIGNLILLPRSINSSYRDATYETKLEQYFGQNLLAKTLHEKCYINNPPYLKYIRESKINFKPHKIFSKSDIQERQQLYIQICKEIWNYQNLDEE